MIAVVPFGKGAEEANKTNDTVRKTLAKTGLLLVAVSEIVLLVGNIIEFRKEKLSMNLKRMMNNLAKEQRFDMRGMIIGQDTCYKLITR